MKALVVDPSRTYRHLVSSVLSGNGFHPDEVEGCLCALSACEKEHYDLVCMSQLLTQGESFELAVRIRSCALNHSTPIVMLTGNYQRDVIEKAYASGITEVFKKKDFSLFEMYLRDFSSSLLQGSEESGRILYAEDCKSVAAVTQAMLKNAGYYVHHVTSVQKAYEAFCEQRFDLILTDLLLEDDASGSTLVKQVRNHAEPQRAKIPIIAVTAFNDTARKLELFRSGINDYIVKPVMEEELLARARSLVNAQHLLHRLEEQQQRLQDIALRDQLTGLHNRHFLVDAVAQRVAQARRHGRDLSLIVMDVDHFKAVNDNHGHVIGDYVLKEIGVVLKQMSRQEDVVARYGGEEFVVLLDNCCLKQAMMKAESLRSTIASLNPNNLPITASFGVSSFLEDDEDFSSLFERADKAVYCAKERGRNCVHANPCI